MIKNLLHFAKDFEEFIFQKASTQMVPAIVTGIILSTIFAFRMVDYTSIQIFAADFSMFVIQFYFLVILLSILRKNCVEKRSNVDVVLPTNGVVCVYP